MKINTKIIVIDNIFNLEEMNFFKKFKNEKVEWGYWNNMGDDKNFEKIFEFCKDFYDISNIVGYECWSNTYSKKKKQMHDWHFDEDIALYKRTKIHSFPLFTAIYYCEIENLKGGRLILESGESITPCNNRLVILPAGIFHSVEKFEGTRKAVQVSPWNDKPTGYD